MSHTKLHLDPDRYFDPDPTQRGLARELYEPVANLPLVCPHGHVDPGLFVDENATFGTPTDLFIIPDHYVFRMLYSQGIPVESVGVPRSDGGPVEQDHRKIWHPGSQGVKGPSEKTIMPSLESWNPGILTS